MTTTKILLLAFIAAAPALPYSGDSFAAKFEAMPQAAQDTAKANMEHALPISIVATQRANGWEYQVNTRLNGETHNLVIDDKGKLLAVKDGTDLDSLPAAVKSALQKQASAADITVVEKVTEDTGISYGAVMKADTPGKFLRVSIAPDGTVKSKTQQNTDR